MHPPPRVNVGPHAQLQNQAPLNHAPSGARNAFDPVLLPARAVSADMRSLYRDGYALAEPHLPYLRVLFRGVDDFLGAMVCLFIRPREVWVWCRKNVTLRKGVLRILARTGCAVLIDTGRWTGYSALVTMKFLSLPWRSPEDRAKLAYLRMVDGKGKQRAPGPTPDG